MSDDLEISGDTDAWFALLEAGVFGQQWDLVQCAIGQESAQAAADLHRETPPVASWPTHQTLDASED